MIPIQLELRNFMSYGEGHPPLCLDGIHVACLSGPNGHGKSTLLDAMVWALWGEPRGGARGGDDLIRHGASEMRVSFEFEAGGTRYRVTRRRSKPGKTGTTELHFESWDGDSWRSLDGTSAVETQRIIGRTLHMTHDTFVHASFISQGRADAFMAITPQQRKQVLGEILDLGRYDELAEAAREARRTAETEANRLGSLIQNIASELARRDSYVEQMHAAEHAEQEAKALAERLSGERTALVAEVNRLEIVERQANDKAATLRRSEERVRTLEQQLRDLRERILQAEAIVARGAEIERNHAAYLRLDEEERRLEERFEPWREASDDVREAEAEIVHERTRLESQLQAAQQRVHELEARRTAAPDLELEAERLRSRIAEFEAHDEQLAAARSRVESATESLARLKIEGERLKAAVSEAEQRHAMLGEHDTCPLCGQLLGTEGLAAAHHRLDAERHDAELGLDAIRKDYARQSADAKAVQDQIKALQAELTARPATARRLGEIDAQLRQLGQEAERLQEAQELAAALEQTLMQGDYAHKTRERLTALRARLATIDYDPERFRTVRAERDALRDAPQQMQRLELARATVETHEVQRTGLDAQLLLAQDEVATARADLENLHVEVARLPSVRTALRGKESELDLASRAHIQAARDLGEAKQHVDWLAEQERSQRSLIAKRLDAQADVSAYTQLAEAFGKNGIQEMIVDQAIPEIEEAANELLDRLTDGRMRVTLNTQRQGRSGGSISTLDVDVADELGQRPYELFSGGEKFRINFAIRIALSRLLARRAGVPLQMLAIDEGFGSQDRQGCDRLVEAIKAVQDDFARVLVITHLDELRDAFPVHIEVTKTHEGSTFSII
jgi:exonuclease SbcC